MARVWLPVTAIIAHPFHRCTMFADYGTPLGPGDVVPQFEYMPRAGSELAWTNIGEISQNFGAAASLRQPGNNDVGSICAIASVFPLGGDLSVFNPVATSGTITMEEVKGGGMSVYPQPDAREIETADMLRRENGMAQGLAMRLDRLASAPTVSAALIEHDGTTNLSGAVAVPTSVFAAVLSQLWERKGEQFMSAFDMERQPDPIWLVSEQQPEGFWYYRSGFQTKVRVPAPIRADFRIPLEMDDATGEISALRDADAAAYVAQDAYTSEMLKAIALYRAGSMTLDDLPSSARPTATSHPNLTPEALEEMDAWWSQMEAARSNLVSRFNQQPTKPRADWQIDFPTGTDAEYREHVASQIPDKPKTSSSWWQSIKDGLSATGSWLGSTIKDWGPVGIIGGWAGYEAVSSAKKSALPPWLIIGGIGLLALMVMK